MAIADTAVPIAATGLDDGERLRPGFGHRCQRGGDVDAIGCSRRLDLGGGFHGSPLRRERVTPQKITDQRENVGAGVFEDEMAGVGKAMDLGRREAPTPLGEEVTIEYEIASAPANQYRQPCEAM